MVKKRPSRSLKLLALATALGIAVFTACGSDGNSATDLDTNLTPEEASELALAYVREQGLFGEDAPQTSGVAAVTFQQVREILTGQGFADPFDTVTPPLSEDAKVWMVSFIGGLILPTPGQDPAEPARANTTISIVDDVTGEVIWAERQIVDVQP